MVGSYVLATCGIRRLGEAFESTPFHRSLLADSSEEEYNLKPCICSSSPRGMDTVKGMLTFITRLTELCLQSLHHRYVAWTLRGAVQPSPHRLLMTMFPIVTDNGCLSVPFLQHLYIYETAIPFSLFGTGLLYSQLRSLTWKANECKGKRDHQGADRVHLKLVFSGSLN